MTVLLDIIWNFPFDIINQVSNMHVPKYTEQNLLVERDYNLFYSSLVQSHLGTYKECNCCSHKIYSSKKQRALV